MPELLDEVVAEPRFSAALVGAFAGAALLLAAVGVYGVLSYTVTQRTGEIGVRMALGARRGQVVGPVVGQGLLLAGAGVTLGTLGALAGARVLESLLVGVVGRDPVVFAAVPAVLVLVAGAATWLPARRASRVDPAAALRE